MSQVLNDWRHISFEDPWLLLLLGLLPLLYVVFQRTKKRQGSFVRFSDLRSLENKVSLRARLRKLLPLLSGLAFVLIILALARPQTSLEEQKIEAEGIDIMLVMDLSPSMGNRDIRPNRLEVAKEAALAFVDQRKYDRIGLTIFAGEPLTLSPPTTDHAVIRQYLQTLRLRMLAGETAIGDGLMSGLNRLKNSESKSKVAILLSDGENTQGYVNPMTSAEVAKTLGVKLYTIGLVENSATLRDMAALTGGTNFYARNKRALEEVYNKIDELEKTKIEVAVLTKYAEKFHAFAWWGIGLLLLTHVLNQTFLRALPH
ncbi:MAG: VWA domain-containing protein [Saprospiraceae bacterium]|nr:VWA domain-containing protein [Saprospiraceae bacterium]